MFLSFFKNDVFIVLLERCFYRSLRTILYRSFRTIIIVLLERCFYRFLERSVVVLKDDVNSMEFISMNPKFDSIRSDSNMDPIRFDPTLSDQNFKIRIRSADHNFMIRSDPTSDRSADQKSDRIFCGTLLLIRNGLV